MPLNLNNQQPIKVVYEVKKKNIEKKLRFFLLSINITVVWLPQLGLDWIDLVYLFNSISTAYQQIDVIA